MEAAEDMGGVDMVDTTEGAGITAMSPGTEVEEDMGNMDMEDEKMGYSVLDENEQKEMLKGYYKLIKEDLFRGMYGPEDDPFVSESIAEDTISLLTKKVERKALLVERMNKILHIFWQMENKQSGV